MRKVNNAIQLSIESFFRENKVEIPSYKICNGCHKKLPATNEYFHKEKHTKDKLTTMCGMCRAKYNREFYNIEENKEKKKVTRQLYTQKPEVRKRLNEYAVNRRKDIKHRINHSFSSLIHFSLKRQGTSKNDKSWKRIVNYNVKDLMRHLESKFTDGMKWDNYGYNGWHIDHIIPIASFNFTSYKDEEFQKCWALTNLQPLWRIDNQKKSNKILNI